MAPDPHPKPSLASHLQRLVELLPAVVVSAFAEVYATGADRDAALPARAG